MIPMVQPPTTEPMLAASAQELQQECARASHGSTLPAF